MLRIASSKAGGQLSIHATSAAWYATQYALYGCRHYYTCQRATCTVATFTLSPTLLCGIRNTLELRAEETQLGMELIVATLNMLDAPDT